VDSATHDMVAQCGDGGQPKLDQTKYIAHSLFWQRFMWMFSSQRGAGGQPILVLLVRFALAPSENYCDTISRVLT